MLLARRIAAVAVMILVVGGVAPAARQAGQGPARPAVGVQAGAQDARETRELLTDLLRRHPPTLGRVLKTDPSLLTNEAYLAAYPALAAFVAGHPEIAHDAAFFFEHVSGLEEVRPSDPRSDAISMFGNIVENMTIFAVIVTITLALAWLVRTMLDWRRWTRLARSQGEAHGKLLDRFTANEDLLSYIQTPAGRRFLESGPVLAEAGPRPLGAPVSRILWSFQAGIVLVAAGIGLAFVSRRAIPEVGDGLSIMGVLAIALGFGFALSGVAAWVISRRMGLFEPVGPRPEPHDVTAA